MRSTAEREPARQPIGQRQRGQQPAEEADVAEGDAKLRQAQRPQRSHRQGDRFGIGGVAGRADQLDARLDELVLAAGARRLVAEHAADIADPQRHRLVVQAGADHARRGDGHVRPQRQRAAVAVEEAVHLGVDLGADVGGQRVGIFEGGQDHLAVAPGAPEGAQRRRHAAHRRRIGKQQVTYPFRQRPVGGERRRSRCRRRSSGRSIRRCDRHKAPFQSVINKKGLVEPTSPAGQAQFDADYLVRLPSI